eukprot:gene5082-10171_t
MTIWIYRTFYGICSHYFFLLIFVRSIPITAWHAYDMSGMLPSSKDGTCNKYEISNDIKHHTTISNRFDKPWTNEIFGNIDTGSNAFLFGLEYSLEKIYQHQHPKNCSAVKFIINPSQRVAGFGSEIHVEGALLAYAMSTNRVLIDNEITTHFMSWKFKNKFCSSQKKFNKECYYLPWSSCSLDDALGGRNHNIILKALNGVEVEDIKVLNPMRRDALNYWWRAISATYLMRPNIATLQWLEQHRTLPLAHNETSEDPSVLKEAQLWAEKTGWKLVYTTIFDRNKSQAKLNRFVKKGLEEEYLAMILNLEYSLRCDAWVCTLASNFCRIIDELRTTIIGKAHRPFIDLSIETCSKPPCVNDFLTIDLGVPTYAQEI